MFHFTSGVCLSRQTALVLTTKLTITKRKYAKNTQKYRKLIIKQAGPVKNKICEIAQKPNYQALLKLIVRKFLHVCMVYAMHVWSFEILEPVLQSCSHV